MKTAELTEIHFLWYREFLFFPLFIYSFALMLFKALCSIRITWDTFLGSHNIISTLYLGALLYCLIVRASYILVGGN